MSESAQSVRVVGLCGRSGAGKTTVCKVFEKYGVKSIDTDKVYRELVSPEEGGTPSPLLKSIAAEFGDGVILTDGTLNRAALAGLVFGDGNEERLSRLNSITHGAILSRTEELIDRYLSDGAVGVLVDAPALFESGFHKKCDAVLCVSAPDDVLIRRIIARDSISEEAAIRRLSSQIDETELLSRADFVIDNSGLGDLEAEAEKMARMIFGIADAK